jgi:hypothetical protein
MLWSVRSTMSVRAEESVRSPWTEESVRSA